MSKQCSFRVLVHICNPHSKFRSATVNKNSFIKLALCLSSLPGVEYLLSERFCQDPEPEEDAMTAQMSNSLLTTLFL